MDCSTTNCKRACELYLSIFFFFQYAYNDFVNYFNTVINFVYIICLLFWKQWEKSAIFFELKILPMFLLFGE